MINESLVLGSYNLTTVFINNTIYADQLISDLIHTYTQWDIYFLFIVIIYVFMTFYKGYLDRLPISQVVWEKITDIHFFILVILGVIILYWCMFNLYIYFTT